MARTSAGTVAGGGKGDGMPEGPLSDAYLSLKDLAAYSGLSVRTLRNYIAQLSSPLPHFRVGGKILVKRSEFDGWASQFRVSTPDLVNHLVADALKGF